MLGLCAIAVAVYFLFRRRRQQAHKHDNNIIDHGAVSEQLPGTAGSEQQSHWPKEVAASPSVSEAPPNGRPHELSSPAYAAELENTPYHGELPAWQGHEMGSK